MANPLYIIGSTTAPTDKATPVNGDNIPLLDSADSSKLKKLSWTNIKATLKTYFDTLYQASGTYVISVAGTAPVASSGGTTPTISMHVADSTHDGYLSSTDWSTFNGKQAALTIGNLTESTSSVLTITGGTGAIIGSGLTIQVTKSDATHSGYLSSTDWSTFNGKQPAGTYVTSVTGTSPVASSGGTTPAISLASGYGDTQNPYASKTANYFLSAPNGSAGVPTFRAIVAADIPTLNQNTSGTAAGLSATLVTTSGGTGLTSFTSGGGVYASSTSALATGSVLTFDGSKLSNTISLAGNKVTALLNNNDYTAGNRNAIQIRQQVAAVGSISAFLGVRQSDYYVFLSNDSITADHIVLSQSGDVGIGKTPTSSRKLDVAGDIGASGNLVIGTSGKGIDFSATANATGMTSELLNDYEEGTWTAVFTGSVSSPTYSGGIQTCQYTKIGRVVYLQGSIYATSVSGGSGNLTITGLPFAPASGSTYYSAGIAIGSNWGTAAPQVIRITGNALSLGIAGNTGAFNATPVSNLKAYADLYFFVSYVV